VKFNLNPWNSRLVKSFNYGKNQTYFLLLVIIQNVNFVSYALVISVAKIKKDKALKKLDCFMLLCSVR